MARDWLQADLQHWTKTLEAGKAEDRTQVRQKMQHWRQAADLASVRDPQALGKLPAAERDSWGRLWADVDDLLARAAGKP
jgi:hypothetical protein